MGLSSSSLFFEYFWWLHGHGVPLRVRKSRNDAAIVHDRNSSLQIPDKKRRGLYKRGIRYRIDELTRGYGVPEIVPLRPGDTVLDIGANVGEFSIAAANKGAFVYSFEPDPIVFACLCENLVGRKIESLKLAVWHKSGELKFYLAPEYADSSALNKSSRCISVQATTLDAFVQERALTSIRLIKCDAEGGEPEVLTGAGNTLRITQYVSIECGFERNGRSTLDDCTSILSSASFEVIRWPDDRRDVLLARNLNLTIPAAHLTFKSGGAPDLQEIAAPPCSTQQHQPPCHADPPS